jgi:hypothetical protein
VAPEPDGAPVQDPMAIDLAQPLDSDETEWLDAELG